jgi:alcohol dehydrogenase class IV
MQLKTPGNVLMGAGCINELPDHLPGQRVLLVTGRTFAARTGLTARITDILAGAGKQVEVFNDVPPEPEVRNVQAGLDRARELGAETVVAVGGGSALDVGKAIAGLCDAEGDAACYFDGAAIDGSGIFFAAVPSTAGTGSEATPNSVLVDRARGLKKSIRAPHMMPGLAVLDPEVTLSAPSDVTAHSGMDALVQGIEALFSRNANVLTSSLAVSGVRLIHGALRAAYADGSDVDARRDMLYASFLVGVSFANARLGAVHGLAHPVGIVTGAPHGLVCARLIVPVLRRNHAACREVYDELSAVFGTDPLEYLAGLMSDLAIAPGFDATVTTEEFRALTAYTAAAGSMKANPVAFNEQEQQDILEEAGITVRNDG